MATVQRWCRVTVLAPDGSALAEVALEGPGTPDLAAVDDVARLALVAIRLGGRVALTEVSPAMRGLLDLVGLFVEGRGVGPPSRRPAAE